MSIFGVSPLVLGSLHDYFDQHIIEKVMLCQLLVSGLRNLSASISYILKHFFFKPQVIM